MPSKYNSIFHECPHTLRQVSLQHLRIDDIVSAMKDLRTYIDITPNDVRVIFNRSLQHAKKRIYNMPVEEIADTNFISVVSQDTVHHIVKIMSDADATCVPVVDNDVISGVITEDDILRLFGLPGHANKIDIFSQILSENRIYYDDIKNLCSHDIMSYNFYIIDRNETIARAIAIILDNHASCLLVMGGEKLFGIIPRTDILYTF